MDTRDVVFGPVVRSNPPLSTPRHSEVPVLPVLVRRLAVDLLRVDSQACRA